MRRKGLFLLIFFFTLNSYAITTQDSIKIGTLYYNPPFEQTIESSQVAYGFNIDIINSLCKVMKKNCKLVPMRFDKLLKALNMGQIDAMMVGISLVPENPEDYLFSYPYFISEAVFVARKSSEPQTLNNKTVGIVKNTLFPMAKQYTLYFPEHASKSMQHKDIINFKYFNTLPELLTSLDKHQVNAIVLDSGVASYWINQSNSKYVQIGPVIQQKKGMAIMSTKNKAELIKQFNQALLTIEANKTLLHIYKKYWGSLKINEKLHGYLIKNVDNNHHFSIPNAFNSN